MKTNNVKCKPFKLGELFCSIYKAKAHIKAEYDNKNFYYKNSIRFVSRTDNNNGCDCYIEKTDTLCGIEMGNAIVIGDTTASLSYQDKEFVCGDHMVVCRAEWLNYFTAMFILTMLKQEKYKYSYGRAFKLGLIKETIVWLPVNENNNVDWSYVETYMSSLKSKEIKTAIQNSEQNLQYSQWREFKIDDIFKCEICKSEDFGSLEKGDMLFVGRTSFNNGIQGLVECDNLTKGKCITLGMVGSFFPFWQEKDFVASQNILSLRNPNLNKYNALFVISCLKKLIQGKHSYNRPIQKQKFINEIISLPVKDKEPDWDYMENYIKSLPYSDRI